MTSVPSCSIAHDPNAATASADPDTSAMVSVSSMPFHECMTLEVRRTSPRESPRRPRKRVDGDWWPLLHWVLRPTREDLRTPFWWVLAGFAALWFSFWLL